MLEPRTGPRVGSSPDTAPTRNAPSERDAPRAPSVRVHSPSKLIGEALGALLRKAGFEVLDSAKADVSVCDLRSFAPPFPPPPARDGSPPSLALVAADERARRAALEAGYRGCLDGEESADALREMLQAVLRGEVWAARDVGCSTTSARPLSERERQVLALLVQGFPNKRIARLLGLAEGTVKGYVSELLYKFGAKNRAALIAQRGRNAWFGGAPASSTPEPDNLERFSGS